MAEYDDVSADVLAQDPETFYATVTADGDAKSGYDEGLEDDEDEIENGLDEFEGGVNIPHRSKAEWKELIAEIQPPQALSLQGAYQREKSDKKHRMGDLLGGCFKKYEASGSGLEFFVWLDAMPDLDRVMMIANAMVSDTHGLMRSGKDGDKVDSRTNVKPSMVKAFIKGVAYLDKTGRKSHRVRFSAGTAMLNDSPLDTAHMQTVFSGKGFGIWVMNEKGKMWVGSHVKGLMHHSSFLSGADVMCGGELLASAGRIVFLSAKTGHYQAQLQNLKYALNVLELSVSNFDQIKVLVWDSGQAKMLSPRQVLFSNHYSSWHSNLTAEESKWMRNREFDKFPS